MDIRLFKEDLVVVKISNTVEDVDENSILASCNELETNDLIY